MPERLEPSAEGRRIEPESRLGWAVYGPVRGGGTQMIGLLDYSSGDVVWDVRPLTRARS